MGIVNNVQKARLTVDLLARDLAPVAIDYGCGEVEARSLRPTDAYAELQIIVDDSIPFEPRQALVMEIRARINPRVTDLIRISLYSVSDDPRAKMFTELDRLLNEIAAW